MGLITKAKKTLGLVKNKAATALSGITKGKIGGVVKGTLAKAGVTSLIKVATKSNVAARAVGVGILAQRTYSKFGSKAVSTKKKGLVGTALKTAGAVALVAAGAFGVEKVAEKLGVRGGTGFIGRRRTRRKGKGKYAYIRVARNRRGKGKLTKSEEKRLRSSAKSYANSEGNSRRSRRKKGKRGSKSYMAWVRSHRRKK